MRCGTLSRERALYRGCEYCVDMVQHSFINNFMVCLQRRRMDEKR